MSKKWLALALSFTAMSPCLAQDIPLNVAAGRLWGYYSSVEAIDAECASELPDQKSKFDAAMDPWTARSKPLVDKARKAFLADIAQTSKSEADRAQTTAEFEQSLKLFGQQITAEMASQVKQNPQQACDALVRSIGSGQGELSVRFPQEFKVLGLSADGRV